MTDTVDRELRRMGISLSRPVLAVIAIIFGILVIIFPSLLSWIVGIYLIIQGILFLVDYMQSRRF